MALNIKNQRHRSRTRAVEERLDRCLAADAGTLARLRTISIECGSLWLDKTLDHGELLYDSRGLPK